MAVLLYSLEVVSRRCSNGLELEPELEAQALHAVKMHLAVLHT